METILSTIWRIVEFVLAFGVLIFLHELGHYVMCRVFKIEVEEFGFGFPPRMVKLFTYRGTIFSLNWIPFGAFVRPRGENDDIVEGGLSTAPVIARFLVFLGGPLVNLLVGIILFTVVFSQSGMPDPSVVQVLEVAPNSPAEKAGLIADDIIVKINGEEITSSAQLSSIIKQHLDESIDLIYQRGDEPPQEIQLTPRGNPPENQGALGIVMTNPVHAISFIEAVPYAFLVTGGYAVTMVTLPVMLIQGQVSGDEARFVGPKGMYDIFSQARQNDEVQQTQGDSRPLNTLTLLATISIALGFTNLLPLPALDGGRILFLLPEMLFRRKIPQQYENMVHLIGLAALIVLMVYITTQDFINPIPLP